MWPQEILTIESKKSIHRDIIKMKAGNLEVWEEHSAGLTVTSRSKQKPCTLISLAGAGPVVYIRVHTGLGVILSPF